MSRTGSFVLVVALAIARAPYQCGKTPDPSMRREDSAAEALYAVAGKLRKGGDERGYRETLAYLIEHYPSSRYAEAARVDLADDGSAPETGP